MNIKRLARAGAREALSLAKKPVSSARFRRAAARPTAELNIALGCETTRLVGWICTDVTWRGNFYLDMTKPWPVPAGSVDRVFADNVIEHLSLPSGRAGLRHTLAALKPGGRLRLATPDIEALARMYLANDAAAEEHLRLAREDGFDAAHPVDLLRGVFTLHGHHRGYLYDWQSLAEELAAAGFSEVTRCEAGDSPDPVMRGLEQRMTPTERQTTLVVEAVRPTEGRPQTL